MPKTFLPDVNVWLALTFDSHLNHPIARKWFDGLTDKMCLFCRMTQQGFLRLVTNSKVFGTEAVTLPDAWKLYDAYMGDPRVGFAPEPMGIETFWRGFTRLKSFSPHVWNDAWLAAFAKTVSMDVVTFDNGFTQYADVPTVILA